MNLRCSALPLAFKCGGSLRPAEGEVLIDPIEEGGQLGSAVHEALAHLVGTGELPDVRPLALKYEVDSDEVGRLTFYGNLAWQQLRSAFPDPMTEQEVKIEIESDWILSGHIDVLSFSPEVAALVDWKSGYKQSDFYHQLMGYADLLFLVSGVQSVRCSIVWLREHMIETFTLIRPDSATWSLSLAREVLAWDGVYHPGEHCTLCRRFSSCPARIAMARAAIEEVGGPPLTDLLDVQEIRVHMPAVATLYRTGKIALAKEVLDRINNLVRIYIKTVGPIPLDATTELALVEEPRDTIDPLKAWPIISKYLTDVEFAPAVKIGKTALLDAISAKAPKGQKGKAKTQLMEELKAAWAVTQTPIYKLKAQPIRKELKP
jgi:hypothetical protein